jgi:iron complex outermembrane receptor protein
VERIDIIKGPSAEFGGVAGTLNIILRAPPRTTQRESRATVTYRTLQPTLSAWGQWGDRQGAWSWSLPLAANRWAGETRTESQRLTRGRAGERNMCGLGRDVRARHAAARGARRTVDRCLW